MTTRERVVPVALAFVRVKGENVQNKLFEQAKGVEVSNTIDARIEHEWKDGFNAGFRASGGDVGGKDLIAVDVKTDVCTPALVTP